MTNAPIRIVVLLAAISLAGILATQAYWASQAITSQEKQFSHSVQMALRNVVESLCEQDGYDFPSNNPIEQVSNNYFIVRSKNKIDLQSLEYLLKAELQKRVIDQDFEYGVYDCISDVMVYGDFVNMGEPDVDKKKGDLPKLAEYDTYFGVFFPGISNNPLWGLDWWKFTTGLTLIVVIFFGYTMFVILKQKRLSTIQRDFINNVTHEFKTPLSTLKVASAVLSEPGGHMDPDRMSRYANIITAESNRLEKHVDQLLSSAFIEYDKHVELNAIDASSLVHQIVERFDLREENIEFHFICDQNVNVLGDHYLLQTALYNLIDNAIKYGNGSIEICIKSESDVGIISVSDNGKGILQSQIKQIFKKFYRISEGDQHNVKGFGLGLFVVKKAMERMNGTISVNTKPQTTFTMKLALA